MHPGPALFCPTSLANQINGLLYVDWNDNTATDQTLNPATPTVGSLATISGGAFHCLSPPTIVTTTDHVVTWDASKFQQTSGQAFTMEAKARWLTMPNVTQLIILRIVSVEHATFHQLAFFGGSPQQLYYENYAQTGGSPPGSLGVAVAAGSYVHAAAVVPAGSSPTVRLYVAGSYVGSVALASALSPTDTIRVSVGDPTNQGAQDTSVDWLRVSLGELYTGTGTYPVPPNN